MPAHRILPADPVWYQPYSVSDAQTRAVCPDTPHKRVMDDGIMLFASFVEELFGYCRRRLSPDHRVPAARKVVVLDVDKDQRGVVVGVGHGEITGWSASGAIIWSRADGNRFAVTADSTS